MATSRQSSIVVKLDTLHDQHKSWRVVAKVLGAPFGEINSYAAMLCRAANGKPPNPKLRGLLREAGLIPPPRRQFRRAADFSEEEALAWDQMMQSLGTTTTEWMRERLEEWQKLRAIVGTQCSTGNTD